MNGDWFTYLLILIFFVFPLIQQILESRKRQPPAPPPAEDTSPEDWTATRLPQIERPRREGASVTVESGGGWSEGWGSWPQEKSTARSSRTLEPVPSDTTKYAEAAAEPELPQVWMPKYPEPVPEAGPAYVTAVDSHTLPQPVAPEPERIARVIPLPTGRTRPDPFAAAQLRILAGMRSPTRLRETILLTEVLGPPKSLRLENSDGNRD